MPEGIPSREQELFQACLDLRPEERGDYLAWHCEDAELRSRVEDLLRAYEIARDSSTIGLDFIALEAASPFRIGP